jgi:uncharacterized protein (DUF2336 family)
MAGDMESLENLVRLSRETSSEGRVELLHEITDLFLENHASHSDQENAYFGEILGRLVPMAGADDRQQLSHSVAAVPTAPSNLVKTLAQDELSVAKPVLSQSTVLTNEDLVVIIKQQSQGHLLAISSRQAVPEIVADALVERGNDDVLDTLADNKGAVLSDLTMETMVNKSTNPGNLAKTLASRDDTAPQMIDRMLDHITASARKYVEEHKAELSDEQISELLKEAQSWAVQKTINEQQETAISFIARKEQLGLLDGKLLLRMLRTSEIEKFIAGIAQMASIGHDIARDSAFDKNAEKLAIICKSQDIDVNMFMNFYDLTNFDKSRTTENRQSMEGVYRRMTTQAAQRALRFMKTRSGVQKKLHDEASTDTKRTWS